MFGRVSARGWAWRLLCVAVLVLPSRASGQTPQSTTPAKATVTPPTAPKSTTSNTASPTKAGSATRREPQTATKPVKRTALATKKQASPAATASATASATAQRFPAPPTASTPPPKPAAPAPESSTLQRQLELTASRIEQLVKHTLDPSVAPASLFDVDLNDPSAIALERARLQVLLPSARDAGVMAVVRPEASDAGGPRAALVSDRSWSEGELRARIRLDRARLTFYELSVSERQAALDAQREQQETDRASAVEQQAGEAEQRAMQAERQRQAALAQAQHARTEALRLVAEEHARLLGISAAQAQFEARLLDAKKQLVLEQEQALSQRRQVREVLQQAERGQASADDVSDLYATLRSTLRQSRQHLDVALSDLDDKSQVPVPGEDRTGDLPADVDASEPRAKHAEVSMEAHRLEQVESDVRTERVDALFERVQTLNADRLALYPHLSSELRDEIVGFGPSGWDQARAEIGHVVLTARYSISELRRWLSSMAGGGGARGESAWAVSAVALKWLMPIGVFWWWRRRATDTLGGWRTAARKERRLGQGTTPTPVETVLGFVMRIRRPAESLLLTLAVVWLLPVQAQERLEVQVLASILHWTLGGALVVAVIDAFAERGALGSRTRTPNAELRLKSLKLLGRVVVLVALILSLSDELVGKGTVYDWVLSTCWFAALPVSLVIAGWWKQQIYDRLQRRRKKNALMTWALEQQGWRSLLVALGTGAFFFYEGVIRRIKPVVTGFDVSRRLLAYLFRRDLSKRTEAVAAQSMHDLPSKLFTTLGPSTPSTAIVESIADDQVTHVIERIKQPGGGVFALVGERGSGKTTLLRRIAAEGRDVAVVKCPLNITEAVDCIARAVGVAEGSNIDECAAHMNDPERDAGLLFDDAHRLLKPTMGGLALFDQVLEAATRNSTTCCWVFAFDEVMWTFLQRARGTKPLFDEVIALKPWGEEAIARLLTSRSKQADIKPSFENLVGPLPKDADAIDVQEALERTSTGYHRLIWDYATGNPGIALHTWRASLALDSNEVVTVRNFHAPDSRTLEALPDDASFVLRAVVQLEFATVSDLVEATQLSRAEVQNALRFGIVRGYFEVKGEYHCITWSWYRPITRFLERRHLLVRK